MTLIDTHCHLDFPDFDTERAGVISAAKDAGVVRMVTICTRVHRFDAICAIAEAYDSVWCSVGTHPHNAAEETHITPNHLIGLADRPRVVAIGEAGLDYHYDKSPRDEQAASFRVHIAAARRTGLPLVIHARSADDDMISILEEETGKGRFPFILHCFSSGAQLAQVGVKLGGYVSFSGILTFKNSQDIRSIAAEIPVDRLLVETDAPYLAPVPHRGKRNEPAYVEHTAAVLAKLRQMPVDEIAEITTENALRVFSRMPPLEAA